MKRLLLSAAVLAVSAGAASATTIDFESFTNGQAVGTVGVATFSDISGDAQAYAFGGSYAASGVTTIAPSGSGYTSDLYVDFSTAVSGLSFYSGGDDDAGSQGTINVFIDGLFSTSVAMIGDGNSSTVDFHDLSAFSNVTRIEIVDITDGGGLVYDDFTFTEGAVDADVPLPAGAALLLSGLGALAWRRRG